VSDCKAVAGQLVGQEILLNVKSLSYFNMDEDVRSESIIEVRNRITESSFPLFVKAQASGFEVFLSTQYQLSESSAEFSSRMANEQFIEIVPLLMFLRYACGEQCWHPPGYYANLTIDDPWLTEPYGHLSYKGLLEQMEKVDFHTTIAFIPWNYDRSEMEVVSLFKGHEDRLSICVHGNNHDHYEFYKYETNDVDPWPAKPVHVQEANLKQSVARMEKFEDMTQLSYDRVMVFPHGIAPAKTLGLLKKYNFLATSNACNVPLDYSESNEPLFSLRQATLHYEDFASLRRSPVKPGMEGDIAINLFLGNPLLFYGHHDLFKHGTDAFNKTAEIINEIEPSTKWHSLGHIARHLYLQRMREDGNYDIRAFCKSVNIENTQSREQVYFVKKAESFSLPIRQVTVDGERYPWERSGSDLCLTVTIPFGESRLIDIEYQNNFDLASIDISKSDSRVKRLRKLSDFRDITLSRNLLGRAFTRVYYDTGLYKHGLKGLATVCLALTVGMFLACLYLWRRAKRNRLRKSKVN